MGKSRFTELMVKNMTGSANAAELEELEQFLKQFPHYKKVQQVTNSVIQEEDGQRTSEVESQINELWAKINAAALDADAKLSDKKPIAYMRLLKWAGAAAAVLVISLSVQLYNSYHGSERASNQVIVKKIHVPFGQIMQLTLADGTKVKLNAGSDFSYPVNFSGTKREVTLNGEGFFEVSKNAHMPFFVHAGGINVKVLGTVFNVKAYSSDPKIETTLLEGKIEVAFTGDREKKVMLIPHEKLTVNKVTTTRQNSIRGAGAAQLKYEVTALPVTDDNIYPENAWIERRIIFTNTDFEEVALALERKYDVKIVFEDKALGKEQISGALENESLEKALSILKQIIPFQSHTDNKTVYFARKKGNNQIN
jgi:transmembrane sensor